MKTNVQCQSQMSERVSSPPARTKPQLRSKKALVCLATALCVLPICAQAQTNAPGGAVVAWGRYYAATNVPAGLNNIIALAGGLSHSVALKSDGTVVAWGTNNSGETNVPTGLSGVVAIAANRRHSLALKSDGTVVAWGDHSYGQSSPPSLFGVRAIGAGGYHGFAVTSNGTVVAWGRNNYGQTNVPPGLTNVVAVAGGEYHSLALKSDGTVVAWGNNSSGQGKNVPPVLNDVTAIAAGSSHNVALKSDGTVVTWGYNDYGQTNVPTGLTDVVAIAASGWHSLALKSDGTVVAWGSNDYGETNVPPELSGVTAIAAGTYHSLVVLLPPKLCNSPASQTVPLGSTVQFHLDAIGALPITYQWFFNATNLVSDAATNSDLLLTNVQLSQSGAYTVVVTNAFGAVTSSPAILDVRADPPMIVIAPSNRVVGVGGTATFTVQATGNLPLAYQWFFNGTNAIPGANNPVLQLTNTQASHSGVYTVVITNVFGAVTSPPAVLNVHEVVVTNCTETDFRAAIAAGGRVTLSCDGTITLGDAVAVEGDTVLDGSGHQVTISGGNAVRVFYVNSNVDFTIINLTIANGRCTNGAGILNDHGMLTLQNVNIEANWACSLSPEGGGILNRAGALNATNCSFSGNSASPPSQNFAWGDAQGGAIQNESGQVHLDNCVFKGNSVFGGDFAGLSVAVIAMGAGGAIENSGTLTAHRCEFLENSAAGALGFDPSLGGCSGGAGEGGAVFNSATATFEGCSFARNESRGGWSGTLWDIGDGLVGAPGRGGAIFNSGSLVIQNSSFLTNAVYGGDGSGGVGILDMSFNYACRGGDGGSALGGAICNLSSLLVHSSTFVDNGAFGATAGAGAHGETVIDLLGTSGGTGGTGGLGGGGALYDEVASIVVNSTFVLNSGCGGNGGAGGAGGVTLHPAAGGGPGGTGGPGGVGYGGICSSGNSLWITNCTIAFNVSSGGSGGMGGPGGYGGEYGPYGAPGGGGPGGMAGASLQTKGGMLVNAILSSNTPLNFSGTITDFGHNLSSDDSCAFTNAGSLNNTDPMLGPLADNGGPTLTMALLPGSPAIDAGDDAAAPRTDQRGFPRPVGAASDIGAYELCYIPVLQISPPQAGTIGVLVYGLPGQSCRLLASETLENWLPIATNQISPNGTALFQDNSSITQACRFYRLVTP